MKVRFWGTRGSTPAPGRRTTRCGGNTSCVEVLTGDGQRIILDAGSGIRSLGEATGACEATLLLSHYHWDHIQGFPFFGPIYLPQSSVRIFGPEHEGRGPYELLAGQVALPYFPAPASQWLGLVDYISTPSTQFFVGRTGVCAGRLSHPGNTLGYRIEDQGSVLVYMSDNEVDRASSETYQSIVDLASNANVLIHDCQYWESEYASRGGWGHSTPRQAVRVAHDAGAQKLLLFHHDPCHSDKDVEALAEEACRLAGNLEVVIAQEGETIDIPANVLA